MPKEFTLTISDDHADSKLAGKEAQFTVTVSEVKEQKLPELDDEFAKGVADGYDSLADLRGVCPEGPERRGSEGPRNAISRSRP